MALGSFHWGGNSGSGARIVGGGGRVVGTMMSGCRDGPDGNGGMGNGGKVILCCGRTSMTCPRD